jgi:hypothetical protein
MRKLPYITIGKILQELSDDGCPITRMTYLRLGPMLKFPEAHRTAGGWRVYSQEQSEKIKTLIKNNYKIGS